ncbi:MAG: DNA-3-methyladenine glycosylase 2 family protein [Verrucomicrobia bacterium]|nr:DNA-3-methyladenine glycosylase 2 family protein [Verrucomicrobiota bacterium]
MHKLCFNLPAMAPFRLDLTVWALKRRSRNIVDQWNGVCYTRVFIIKNSPIKVEVQQKKGKSEISVVASTHHLIADPKLEISRLLNMTLGLEIDLRWFYKLTKYDKVLHPLVLKYKGVKPPRLPSIFEALVNAIAFQQFSLEAGFSLLNNLTVKYGKPFKEKDSICYAFPEPCELMNCTVKELMSIGFSQNKSKTLILIASTIFHHEETLSNLDELSNDDIVQLLSNFKGIGRWSAEYVLLRGLRRTEILPGDDVGIHKSLMGLLSLRKRPDYDRIKKIEKKWYPYAGLIYFHILLRKLSENKVIE